MGGLPRKLSSQTWEPSKPAVNGPFSMR